MIKLVLLFAALLNGPGSFRPWVVSPVSRFARESFRPGSFRPGSFRPWVVLPLFGESFRPYFSTMPKSVIWCIIMPPTLKKLEGHIAFGLSVCVCVCVCVWVGGCVC